MDFLWRSVRNLCAICGTSSLVLSGQREEKKLLFRAHENYTYTIDKNFRGRGREKKMEQDRNITTVEIYAVVNKSAKARAVYLIGFSLRSRVK